jgi:alcohol dehydrogenase
MTGSTSSTSLDSSFFALGDPTEQQVIYGPGSSRKVGKYAKQFGSRALVVTDLGVSSAGHPRKVMESLESAGIRTFLFEESMENPTDSSVQECAQKAGKLEIDLIIGVGGGSSLDTAKGANFILTNDGSMKDYWGVSKATKPLLPMIAIPTTAGTGSECQSYALISDDQTHRKMACGDPSALPKVTLLDPELTLSQPFSVCTATGMDALAHALESAVCSRRNDLSGRHARQAFVHLVKNLETVWKDPQDLLARGHVLLGAAHAGAAVERSMLGAAHALANPLTAQKGVIHGQAVGLCLPAVMTYNQEDLNSAKIYADLARIAGLADSSTSDQQANGLLLEKVIRLREFAGLPTSLSAVDCVVSELPKLSQDAADQWTGTFNPRPLKESDWLKLYQSIDAHVGNRNER